jgi:purine-binding chemotaxis protein CheW
MDIAKIRKKRKRQEELKEDTSKNTGLKEEPVMRGAGAEEVDTKRVPGIESKGDNVKQAGEINNTEITVSETTESLDQEEVTEILAFTIANEEYAVRLTEIHEIIRYQAITMVPSTPHYVIGVTSLRGKVLPVVDLKLRLKILGATEERQKIIILSGKREPLGALIGSILGVFRFSSQNLLPPPATLTEEEKMFIEGVAKIDNKFISVLNVDEITKVEVL